MSQVAFEKPVEDSVPKINEEIAVGEDLEFQRRWWRFEHAVWVFFALLLAADLAGLFGRGPLAKAHIANSAGVVDYDRIQRTTTPSMIRIHLAPADIQDGKVKLFVSQSMIASLGTERVIPQPESSVVGQDGITYTFAATSIPATAAFAVQPDGPGLVHFTIQVPGAEPWHGRVVIMP